MKTQDLDIGLASIIAKLEAMKTILSQEQLSLYDKKIKFLKEKFIEQYPDLSEEQLQHLNLLFS